MPSVATWWCGEPAALEEVIANVAPPGDQGRVSAAARRADVRRGPRRARPQARASACCARGRTTTSRRSWCTCRRRRCGTARTRACSRARSACASSPAPRPNGYFVMPGGLTRVASAARRARHLDAARRLEQGHLGARLRPGEHLQPAAPLDRRAGPGARRHQPVEPRGREPVLVRPLLRALRRHRAPAARRARPLRRQRAGRRRRARPAGAARAPAPRRRAARRRRQSGRQGAFGRAARRDHRRCAARPGERPAPADARRLQPARAPVARQLAHAEPPDRRP